MTHPLHHPTFSGNGSSQDMPQGIAETSDQATAEAVDCSNRLPDLVLDIQTLQILDSSDDCIKVLDLEGRILFMNRGGQTLLGIQDITPFLNTFWVNFWQQGERQAAIDVIAIAATGEVCSLQGYCPTLNGEPKWWDNKISPILGVDGSVERLLCISRDITARKRAEDERQQTEAALRASEEEFRLFTAACSDTVYKMSADWREMRLLEGKNFLASTQHPNRTWLEQYIPLEEQMRVRAAIEQAIRTKSTFELEHRVIRLDGTIGWTFSRAIPLLNDQNEIVEWLGAASDVTARKRVELSAEFLAIVTQNLAEATCVEEIIQIVGEQLNRYLQVSNCAFVEINESAKVATIHHSWHQEDVPSLVGSYRLSEFVTGEFFQTARLGQTIIVRDATTDPRIADPQRFVALKIGSFINVPLIRNGEWKFTLGIYHPTPYNWRSDEIELMRELANRIKDEFLAVLSHELRSPLNPILGWTRLLQNGKLDAVRQREALATIERNAKLQTQLIEDLLDISRIMRGKLSLTVAPVSLIYVISAAVETVRLAAQAKNLQLILDLAPDVALVSGDAARLQQVVWNLLTNALKFTPSSGQVTVELRQLDRLAQIRVVDTGKGITPQFIPHVFEYFLQEDGSTTRKFGGLGLGLAIVRQIVQMHGGSVWAESQGEGQGATFIVQLPTMQHRAVVSKPSQPQSAPGLPLAGIHILLVDDEPDTREFQAFLLKQSGARVTAVASGLEALQALEQSIPDVVVSDIGMPEMDGYMLLQQIRSRPFEQGGMIPAIALTAYASEIDQQRAIQVGFQRHITKPVEPEALVKAVSTLLERT